MKPLPEPPAPPFIDAAHVMTDEMRALVKAAATQMVATFPEHGFSSEDFSPLVAYVRDQLRLVVAYVADEGVHRGSLTEIVESRAIEYAVEVDGTLYDTRSGMDWATYQAFAAARRHAGGGPTPDSVALGGAWGHHTSHTWLSGVEQHLRRRWEQPTPNLAITTGDGTPIQRWVSPHDDDPQNRFRPAITLGVIA